MCHRGSLMALAAGAALALASCGSRSLPLAEDGEAPETDSGGNPDGGTIDDTRVRPDRHLVAPDAGKPKICATNKDCLPEQFCQHDGICIITGAIAGKCSPRPTNCPDILTCSSVCGCDGKTYCQLCDAHAAGVSMATKQTCFAPTCNGLEAAYDEEIKKAKVCCSTCASLQCVNKVSDGLACGCMTTINTGETPVMQAIKKEFQARSCGLGTPCPGKCASVWGSCENGTCVDNL